MSTKRNILQHRPELIKCYVTGRKLLGRRNNTVAATLTRYKLAEIKSLYRERAERSEAESGAELITYLSLSVARSSEYL